MGRYYSGDIEGKFWFGLQSSHAADRFGVEGEAPAELQYWFGTENLVEIEEEILNIETELGDKLQVIEQFFLTNNGYTDEKLKEAGITQDELSEYADLKLGIKIRDYVKENGDCSFTAEL